MITILQITNGTIDPSWVTTILVAIIGFFLVRTLVKMDNRMDKADKRIDIITRVLLQMLTKLGGDDDAFYDDLRSQLNSKD